MVPRLPTLYHSHRHRHTQRERHTHTHTDTQGTITHPRKNMHEKAREHTDPHSSLCSSATNALIQLAFKYMSWAMTPLLLGYAVYSLLYNEHKGWYSYVINMLAGAVYTFGMLDIVVKR